MSPRADRRGHSRSVARIDDSAFSGCTGLTSVTLHEGLQVIGDGAFRECEGLTSLDLPDGLTTLEDTALYDCANIERFTFPASLSDMELSSIDTSKWYEGLADGAELYCAACFLAARQGVPRQADRPPRHEDGAHRGLSGRRERTEPARRAGIAHHHARRRLGRMAGITGAHRAGERRLH